MVGRVEEQYAAYALGSSLALYASAFVMVWSWRYTAALIAISFTAIALSIVTAPQPLAQASIATIAFYVGTAGVLALVAQAVKGRLAWSEFMSRAALELEQERSGELNKRLEQLSQEDPLTGLANRRSWDGSLEREFARASRAGLPLSVLLCDIDRFKFVNDRLGHAIGDRVLETVAGVLMRRVRTGDLVARIGGDEFAILCADTDLEGAAALAESLRRRIESTDFPERPDDVITVSIGVAACKSVDATADAAMLRADARLYEAKRKRNSICAGDVGPGPATMLADARAPGRY
jgi:diguanylate cyclase (GGDEF)-like protein